MAAPLSCEAAVWHLLLERTSCALFLRRSAAVLLSAKHAAVIRHPHIHVHTEREGEIERAFQVMAARLRDSAAAAWVSSSSSSPPSFKDGTPSRSFLYPIWVQAQAHHRGEMEGVPSRAALRHIRHGVTTLLRIVVVGVVSMCHRGIIHAEHSIDFSNLWTPRV